MQCMLRPIILSFPQVPWMPIINVRSMRIPSKKPNPRACGELGSGRTFQRRQSGDEPFGVAVVKLLEHRWRQLDARQPQPARAEAARLDQVGAIGLEILKVSRVHTDLPFLP